MFHGKRVEVALAFALLKAKPSYESNAAFLGRLAAPATPAIATESPDSAESASASASKSEVAELRQRLVQQEVEAAALRQSLESELAQLRQSNSTSHSNSNSNSNPGPIPPPSAKKSAKTAAAATIAFSKAAQAKAEKACAALKVRDRSLVKDIEFIELIKSVLHSSASVKLSESQSRMVMETSHRIIASLIVKFKTAVSTWTSDGTTLLAYPTTEMEHCKLIFLMQEIARKLFGLLESPATITMETRSDFTIQILRSMTTFLGLVPFITLESETSTTKLKPIIAMPPLSIPSQPVDPDIASKQSSTPPLSRTTQRDLRQEICKIVSKSGVLVPCISHVSVFCLLKKSNALIRGMIECHVEAITPETAWQTRKERRLNEENLCYYLYALDEAVTVAVNGIGKRLNSVLDEENDVELIEAIRMLAKLILASILDADYGTFSAEVVHKVAESVGRIDELVQHERVWRSKVEMRFNSDTIVDEVVAGKLMEGMDES
ncbi:hypothetical protein HDU99_004087 [Rhizoclosmatium hyalinum]|nr:hypothetical protein HDU99_004087 [Rhizoclosmatium hyalinum]